MTKSYSSLLAIAFSILFYSCSGPANEKADDSEITYSPEVTQIINYITSGHITSDEVIEVKFVDQIVNEEDLNKAIDNPFNFSPGIDGDATWSSPNRLVFTPSSPIPSRVNFTGSLDLTTLNHEFNIESVDLKFYVDGREITSFEGDFQLENPSDPNKLVYKGKITFSQDVDLETVEEAVSLRSVKLNWNQESGNSFSFVSNPIVRESSTKQFTFEVDKDDLNLSESLSRVVSVVPLTKLEVSEIEKDELGKHPKARIKFSDQLDPNQSFDGFVSVKPNVNIKVQQLGKYLVLDGNFKFGNEYSINIEPGIKSKWGTKTDQSSDHTIKFSDIAPQVEFASSGIFMPTSNNKQLQFLTTNLKRVHVEVKKVFGSNIDQFFRNESIRSKKTRHNEFNNTYVSNVGAIIYNHTFEIGDRANEWLLHNLSLENVLNDYSNGLYLIRINFNPKDILVPIPGNQLNYIQENGQVYKPVTISDIGIIAKQYDEENYAIYTSDLRTGKPMPGVNVTISRYDNNYNGTTNSEGMAKITARNYINLIKASKNGQTSIIKPYEMEWNTSGFDVSGISPREMETRAFIYTERGVYRPGDSVNLSCIVRYNSSSKDNVPANFRLFNPDGTLVYEDTYKGAKDGFYNFSFGTDQNDPTGDWSAQVIVGNKYFYHDLKIESVVANRLKVKVTPDFKVVLPEHKQLDFQVEGRYLFGASADGMAYETEAEVFDIPSAFPKYKDYTFYNQNTEFKDIKSKVRSGNLDGEGIANVTWNIPNLSQAPSPLKVKLNASVQEEGGRPNHAWSYIDLHPFSHYVGLKDDYSYVKLNVKQEIPVVLVDHKGEAVAGKELVYRIYKNEKYWWYQYDSYRDFKLRFKTDKHSYLVEEGTVSSGKPFASIPFQPAQSGQYLIEVQDVSNGQGHMTSIFTGAYRYGGIPSGDENAGTLVLKSDKDSYEVGESAMISFPSPRQGNILLTIEQGNNILMNKWVSPADKENMNIKVNISEAMVPNAYVTITALQSHDQTTNDRPIRMFGILPIKVVNPDTKQNLVIKMPDELSPKQKFDIETSTLNGRQTQYTIAVVDEGLLDLTNFQTPDPWTNFFQKIRLGINTYDMLGHVIGANAEDVFKTFSIGGDMDYRESQVDPFEKKKRFKPVCMFQGPLMTDSNGKSKVSFTMPNYVGSVRVMVISAKGNTYGSAEKTVPVRSDLIIEPTIPRALKPGDEFEIPVNVFTTKPNIGKVDIEMITEGPLEVIGTAKVNHVFNQEDDQLFTFKLKVKAAVGQAKVIIKGTGKQAESIFEADVPVSPSAARVYQKEEKTIKPGETISFDLPKVGLDGTNNARLHLAVFPNMDFLHRLDWLVRYPYGCIEQTTSSVFPQLALKSLFANNEKKLTEIDQNINAGIDRLRMFQLSNGGFSYWPGGSQASAWGSNYAGQFLIEARRQGYVVPDIMYDGIIKYLERESRNSSRNAKDLMTRVNRCFILALAEKAPINEMNLLKQNEYTQLSNVQKWQLVTAYKLAGAYDKVEPLVEGISKEVDEYSEFGHTYGSRYRDLGIILRCLTILERADDASLMAKHIAEVLSGSYWYSTQTVGQMLLGIGNYFKYAGISASDDLIIEGTVTLPNGKKETIKSVDKYQLYINEGYGQNLSLTINSDVDINQLYATLSSNGVPLKDQSTEQNKNISLRVDWFDEDGRDIDINNIKQGSTFYGRFNVKNESVIPIIEEVALVQLLPSGWEIENTRLSNEIMPSWMESWSTGNEEYLDIRDDRIMWFFDLTKVGSFDFVMKVNAITAGTYQFPGTRCEAMYNNDFVATKAAQTVQVIKGQ